MSVDRLRPAYLRLVEFEFAALTFLLRARRYVWTVALAVTLKLILLNN